MSLQLQVAALAGIAGSLLARRPVDGTLESQIAETAVTSLGDGDDLAGLQQLEQHFAGIRIADDGAHRHVQRDVVTGCTEHVGAHAVLAALGLVATRIAVIHQRVQVHIGHCVHMTATAAVATVGAAKFLVFLVPERRAAIAAVTRLQCR